MDLKTRIHAWLQIVRAPNLPTVPGDPIAGALLAVSSAKGAPPFRSMVFAALAALCLYVFGLIANDLCDAERDARERPRRPIPSGRISKRAARGAACLAAISGIGLALPAGTAAAAAAFLLLALVLLYNAGFKRIAFLGPATMGACRGMSVWLGAAAAGGWQLPPPALVIALGGISLYIAAVTALAKNETRHTRPGWRKEAPWLAWTVAAILLARTARTGLEPLAAGVVVLSIWRPWRLARSLETAPAPERLQAMIGKLIRGLLPAQAALAAVSGHPEGRAIAIGLLILWPFSAALSRHWQGS